MRANPPSPSVFANASPDRSLCTYRVQAGDTLIRIARKAYGRRCGDQYLRIYRANRDKLSDPATVVIGQVLVIPPLRQSRTTATQERRVASGPRRQRLYTEMTLEALAGRFSARRTYTVRAGDCLTEIARRTMGSANRAAVRKLIAANKARLADPDRLTIGLRLKIPEKN